MSKCPECGDEMNREVRLVTYTYKDQAIKVEQPGEWCDCGEAVLTSDDVKATEKTLHKFRENVDNSRNIDQKRTVLDVGKLRDDDIKQIEQTQMSPEHDNLNNELDDD